MSIQFRDDEREVIRAGAAAEGCAMSEYVRRLVRRAGRLGPPRAPGLMDGKG